jgi:hypothetical protein
MDFWEELSGRSLVLRCLKHYRLTLLFVVASVIFIVCQLLSTNIEPVIPMPDETYSVKNDVCASACKNLQYIGCKEWVSFSQPRICEYTCDTYVDFDRQEKDDYYYRKFLCASHALTQIDVQACKLSCTKLDDL